ncbi:MAG: J domain-containing protein [Desulfohalobiaceae bacterium]
MYLARYRLQHRLSYVIRESVLQDGVYVSRDLLDLGPDPGQYIEYPGGNSFYISQEVEDSLQAKGLEPSLNELEDLFWPFVRAEIRHALRGFAWRSRAKRRLPPLDSTDEDYLQNRLHLVDKRRINYLRLGEMDQSQLPAMQLKLYRPLLYMSRDEMEHYFQSQEAGLPAREYSAYVFSFLNLRRFFSEIYAGVMPQALDLEKLDKCFIQDICELNQDPSFFGDSSSRERLHPCLVRYVIMYFDYSLPAGDYLHRLRQDFLARKRQAFARASRQKEPADLQQSAEIFQVSIKELTGMSRRQITRLYRQQAKKLHPDQGGSKQDFIRLSQAYRTLLSLLGK